MTKREYNRLDPKDKSAVTQEYELKLAEGGKVVWEGTDGINAARRYVDCKGGTVIAWRPITHGVFLFNPNDRIID
jgi:hypothetical protein